MGRMGDLALQREDARPAASKLLMEVRYDLEAALGLATICIRDGSLEMNESVLHQIIGEVHAEGEPLKGVQVILPATPIRRVG